MNNEWNLVELSFFATKCKLLAISIKFRDQRQFKMEVSTNYEDMLNRGLTVVVGREYL